MVPGRLPRPVLVSGPTVLAMFRSPLRGGVRGALKVMVGQRQIGCRRSELGPQQVGEPKSLQPRHQA